MKSYTNYPVLEIYRDRLENNARAIVDLCKSKEIEVLGVVKGTDSYENSYKTTADCLLRAGCTSLGDSRINTIIRMREMGVDAHICLLRIPMLSEVADVVRYADSCLVSELVLLRALNEEALRQNRVLNVVLMMDLGDLREGFFEDEHLIEAALIVENELSGLYLSGIGTNLGCYGAIKPDKNNLGKLVELARLIETKISRKLDVVSGGASSSIHMVHNGTIPDGITQLRIGAAFFIGRELNTFWDIDLGTSDDNYIIQAEVIELKEKASYPIGEIYIDAFGNTPEYVDKGRRVRALIALGKRDIADHEEIVPLTDGIIIEGGSSDHLILDVTDVKEDIKIGDILSFGLFYKAMIHITNSSSVHIVYK